MRGFDPIDHEALEGKWFLIEMLLVIGALAAMCRLVGSIFTADRKNGKS